MPVPPNMFRASMRPKAANSSEICARSKPESSAPRNPSTVVPAKAPTAPPRRDPRTPRSWIVSDPPRALGRDDGDVLLRDGFARRRQLDGFAAAAGGNLIGIVEHELRGELLDLEIHLG